MLEDIKLLLGIVDTSKDALLTLLIDQAIEEAQTYTHNSDIPSYGNIICKMVVYNYNRLGTEGVASESYNSTSYSYLADYPDALRKQLNAYRKVVTL